jgi:ectoine hydroxylase
MFYPTRVEKEDFIIRRYDHVVRGNEIAKEHSWLKDYEKDGFAICRNFFNNAEMFDALEASKQIIQDNFFFKVNEPSLNQVRSALNVHHHPKLGSLLSNKRIKAISRYIVGPKPYIHQSRINYKSGKEATGWHWHSDYETWSYQDGMPNMSCFSFMIPLTANNVGNGCLKVIPRSHKLFISVKKSSSESSAYDNFTDQKEGVPSGESIETIKSLLGVRTKLIECSPSDLVIFDCNLLHASDANTTGKPRTNLFFVVNDKSNFLREIDNPRPEPMGVRSNLTFI